MKRGLIGVFVWDTPNGRVFQQIQLLENRAPEIFFFAPDGDAGETINSLRDTTATPPIGPMPPEWFPKIIETDEDDDDDLEEMKRKYKGLK